MDSITINPIAVSKESIVNGVDNREITGVKKRLVLKLSNLKQR